MAKYFFPCKRNLSNQAYLNVWQLEVSSQKYLVHKAFWHWNDQMLTQEIIIVSRKPIQCFLEGKAHAKFCDNSQWCQRWRHQRTYFSWVDITVTVRDKYVILEVSRKDTLWDYLRFVDIPFLLVLYKSNKTCFRSLPWLIKGNFILKVS